MASEAAAPASFIDPKDVLSHIEQQSTAEETSSAASNADPQNPDQTSSPKKKRKSWGQVLPKPTTNLPPRKRAKTAEEKAQRHYERVQRNRQAAHNSRMRKQDEMDRVVSENNRLKQDVQHYQDEIKRLQEEVALYRSSSTTVTPLTPPPDYLSNFSEHQQTSPEPSLTSGSSNTASSPPELADLASPMTLNEPSSDMKQFNDSHSAVDVEFAKYLQGEGRFDGQDMNIFDGYDMIPFAAPAAPADSKIQFDDLLNLDGLDDSTLTAPSANSWGPAPATGFEAYAATDFNLFPTTQLDLSNTCF